MIEEQLERLIVALNANTQAIVGNAGTAPTAAPATLSAIPPAQPAQPVQQAPVASAAVPPTPAAAATPAVASPSEPAVSLAEFQQEVTATYKASAPEKQAQIGALITAQGGALTAIDPAQYGTVLATIRAMP